MEFPDFTERTRKIIGDDGQQKLINATVAVFGVGGVGSYALEALARAGVGTIIITDFDTVDVTNINRQLLTLHSNVGQNKCDIATERLKEINPEISVISHPLMIKPSNLDTYDSYEIDLAVDCIDMVESKIALLAYFYERGIHTVSSMGSALKKDPSKIQVGDIKKTSHCPLAKKVRKGLKEMAIHEGVECIFSTEEADVVNREKPLGTISYMPALFGLHAAARSIDYLLKK